MTKHVTIKREQVPHDEECEIRENIELFENERYAPLRYDILHCFYCRLFDGVGVSVNINESTGQKDKWVRCDGTNIVDGQDIGRIAITVE